MLIGLGHIWTKVVELIFLRKKLSVGSNSLLNSIHYKSLIANKTLYTITVTSKISMYKIFRNNLYFYFCLLHLYGFFKIVNNLDSLTLHSKEI